MEQVEIDFYPRCDDASLPPNSALVQWADYLVDATERRTGRLPIIKVPLNPWPSDPYLSKMGRWYNLGLVRGVEALSLAPFVRMFHWEKEDVDRIVAAAKMDICLKMTNFQQSGVTCKAV
jgi:hypothetical protein